MAMSVQKPRKDSLGGFTVAIAVRNDCQFSRKVLLADLTRIEKDNEVRLQKKSSAQPYGYR